MDTLSRARVIAHLRDRLEPLSICRAVWLAGSDANGRTDAFSDIDLVVIARAGHALSAIDAARTALQELSPLDLEWTVPRPAWHGHDQVFFRLQDAGPHLLIDLVVISDDTDRSGWFLERERHGTPQVLFDPEGLSRAVPLDPSAHRAKLASRLARIRATFPLFQTLVTRAVERGQPTDAMGFYHNFTLLPLVEALRMVYCPDRFDFGLRYLRDDLPAREYQAVCRLCLPGSLEGIRECQREAAHRFAAAMESLGRADQ